MTKPVSILLVGDFSDRFDQVISYSLWVKAFEKHSEVITTRLDLSQLASPRYWPAAASAVLLKSHDVVIFLQSTFWLFGSRRWTMLQRLMAHKKAFKVFFLVNEYRMLGSQIKAAQALNAHVIVSQMPQDVVTAFYGPHFKGICLSVPYCLDPDVFQPIVADAGRSVDIGFRGDPYPIYLGHNDRQKILDIARDYGPRSGLRIDVNADRKSRLGKVDWPTFLNQCRGIIGHEAGTNFLEYDDHVRNFINDQTERLSAADFSGLIAALHKNGVFRSSLCGRSLSPRHFDAIGTKTCQLLLTGRFNDLLKPDEHYIEIKQDLSNIDEALEKFKDRTFRQTLVDRAYQYAINAHTYRHRVDDILKTLNQLG
jgi:hypothetical protein